MKNSVNRVYKQINEYFYSPMWEPARSEMEIFELEISAILENGSLACRIKKM